MEDRRLGRVEIFRPRLARERPPAESDQPSARILDREHDAVAETVIGRADLSGSISRPHSIRSPTGAPAVTSSSFSAVAAFRRIADAEADAILARQPAGFEISARIFGRGVRRSRRKKAWAASIHSTRDLRCWVFWALGDQGAGRLSPASPASRSAASMKESPSIFIQPGEDIAMLAGGKAVIEALLVIDEEGGVRSFLNGDRPTNSRP